MKTLHHRASFKELIVMSKDRGQNEGVQMLKAVKVGLKKKKKKKALMTEIH